MAKKRLMRQRVKQRLKDEPRDATSTPKDLAAVVQSSRVQRKVTKAVRFLDKLKSTQSALSIQRRGIAKKLTRGKGNGRSASVQSEALGSALESLAGSLGSALPSGEEAVKSKKALTAKKRQHIVVQETKQMSAVLSHPAFKSDPFSAVLQHLQATTPSLGKDKPMGQLQQVNVRPRKQQRKSLCGRTGGG